MKSIVKVYHADHGISLSLLTWALSHIEEDGFFCRTFTLPETFSDIECGLYGPEVGDEPISDFAAYMMVRNPERGGNNPPARMVSRRLRPSRIVTVIGVVDGDNVTIYTSYGGPSAPRLPGDASMETDAEKEESSAFWATHALSDMKGGPSYEEAEAEVKAAADLYMHSL